MKKMFYPRLFLAGILTCAAAVAAVSGAIGSAPVVPALWERQTRVGRMLIIDPGHGGADGGAVSVTGTSESRINLDIALRTRALAAFFGVDAVMTRESENIEYPESAGTIRAKKVWDTKRRAELANSYENAFLISIHQNKYTTASPTGCQVFYAPTDGSREPAEALQKEMLKVAPGNRQSAVQIGRDIYLMNNITCPGILVECGFLSNPAEAKKLEDPSYQLTLAAVITGSFIAAGGRG